MSEPELAVSEPEPAAGRPARRAAGPGSRRGLAAVIAAMLLPAALAGCAKFDAALGQQWAVVHFRPGTPVATVLRVRAACSHVPNVQPESLPKVRTALSMIDAVQYRTDKATDADLAVLQLCLQKFPAVTGIDFQDSGSSG